MPNQHTVFLRLPVVKSDQVTKLKQGHESRSWCLELLEHALSPNFPVSWNMVMMAEDIAFFIYHKVILRMG